MTSPAMMAHYRTLTYEQYVRGRIETVAVIAAALRPDYLTVGSEPDIEALFTGQPVNDVVTSTAIVNAMVGTVRWLGVHDVKIGAGVGTWQEGYEDFVRSYCLDTSLDYIDVHLFPINFDFLERAVRIADLAQSLGKPVTIGQAWLYKTSAQELQTGVGVDTAHTRDQYGFWEPLDGKFVEMLVRLAQVKRYAFVTPFWSRYFFAYLDYGEVRTWTPEQTLIQILGTAAENMVNGRYTSTAARYAAAIRAAQP
jgi:hypothetical protein